MSSLRKKIFSLSVLLILISGLLFPDSFAQSFDSKSIGLGMPSISMDPIYGTPGTEVEIIVKNMPQIPENLDPRIEFFVFMPFFLPLDTTNVPQTCGGEKCVTLYSFDEIQKEELQEKKITFTLFSKQNPKSIVNAGFVESICDLRINEKVVERYAHACYSDNQMTGEYEVKFGWGIQSSGVYDIRDTIKFTVINDIQNEEILPQNLDDELIQEFHNGLITVAQFHKGLEQLGYTEKDIQKTKALLKLLEHQFNSLPSKEREIITQACDDLLGEDLLYVTTDKENYQRDDSIFAHGCVNYALPSQDLVVQILHSDQKISETKIIPEVDGSFYTSFPIDEKFAKNGTYIAEIIYGEHKKISTFVVPEFGSITALILITSIIVFIMVSKTKSSVFAKFYP